MRPLARVRHGFCLAAVFCLALVAGGCEDDRGDPAGPSQGPLEGDVLFGSAVVSAEMYRMINAFAEEGLEIVDGGATLPVTINGCEGSGTATITDNNDVNPVTIAVTFTNFTIDCNALLLTLNTDPTVGGKMQITYLETSPGLQYLVELPFEDGEPLGITLQLPSEEGGIALEMSTPLGPLSYVLEGDRASGGSVFVEGFVRLEDRPGNLLIVEVLDLEYGFDDGLIPKYTDWPSGSYEIAGFGGGGGFAFGPPTAGAPVDVFFDGLGGAAFPLLGRTCVVNLETGENPCEDLDETQ